jgi:hypothetical protein
MGHSSGGLALESYVRPTDTDLIEGNDKMIGYVGVLDALTVDENNKLRREVQTLKIRADRLEQVMSDIEEVKKRIGI